MARLANISGKQAVKTFKKLGWNVVGQVGSHVVMTKPGMKANLSVPQHKEKYPSDCSENLSNMQRLRLMNFWKKINSFRYQANFHRPPPFARIRLEDSLTSH